MCFIAADAVGVFARAFSDFGDSFTVVDQARGCVMMVVMVMVMGGDQLVGVWAALGFGLSAVFSGLSMHCASSVM